MDILLGAKHSTILSDSGQLFSIGSNSEGQLGCGTAKSREVVTPVKGFDEEKASVRYLINSFPHIWIVDLVFV